MTEQEGAEIRIKPREIAYFLGFGLIPIVALYVFASQGFQDVRGASFEDARRAVMAACMKDITDRKDCRLLVDDRMVECFEKHADDAGVIQAPDALTTCVAGSLPFRKPTEAQKKKLYRRRGR